MVIILLHTHKIYIISYTSTKLTSATTWFVNATQFQWKVVQKSCWNLLFSGSKSLSLPIHLAWVTTPYYHHTHTTEQPSRFFLKHFVQSQSQLSRFQLSTQRHGTLIMLPDFFHRFTYNATTVNGESFFLWKGNKTVPRQITEKCVLIYFFGIEKPEKHTFYFQFFLRFSFNKKLPHSLYLKVKNDNGNAT